MAIAGGGVSFVDCMGVDVVNVNEMGGYEFNGGADGMSATGATQPDTIGFNEGFMDCDAGTTVGIIPAPVNRLGVALPNGTKTAPPPE
jgi:hypothetical protein